MPPKRANKGKAVAEPSRPRQRARREPNAHGIVFEAEEHVKRYRVLCKRTLLPTRYVCDQTMLAMGIFDDVVQLYNTGGILNFMFNEVPTYERLTLEFLSTVDFNLERQWNGSFTEYFGTMTFRLYNEDYSLSLIELGQCLKLPLVGHGMVPSDFERHVFWAAITGLPVYDPRSAKASWIQNPCFRYAHKGLAYTMFGRGDSTGVVTKRELYLLHAMIYDVPVNVAAFVADHLTPMGKATKGAISVGGLITQIADHCGCRIARDGEEPLKSLSKVDLKALCQQLMLQISPHGYALLSRNRTLLQLPNPNRTAISNDENWLYVAVNPDEGDDEDIVAGQEGDAEAPAQERMAPQPRGPRQHGEGSSAAGQMRMDQFEAEQARQGTELFRQGTQIDNMVAEQLRQGVAIGDIQRMMQQLMLQFPPPQ